MRLQADDKIIVREPKNMRLENVDDQPLIKNDVVRVLRATARNGLMVPERNHDEAALPRRQHDRRT